MTRDLETPVLIVGGGPVGLLLALDLARRGHESTLIEQDPCTAPVILAKAGILNERTMEYCRRLGLVEAVANVGIPDDYPRDTIYCTSLSGHFIGRDPMPSTKDRELPPECAEMLRKCPQFLFDPLVARAVKEAGRTNILYGTRFDRLEQDKDGVTVWVTDLKSDKTYTIRTQYLVGCDGAGSQVRRQLGIGFNGKQLDFSVSAMIRVKALEQYHDFGRAERFMFIDRDGTWANLTSVDCDELWRLTLVGSEEKLDPAHLDIDAVIRKAFGRDDIPYVVERIVPWRRSQFAADRYGEGRVVLAGDAAHTTSPTGGHGLNTGVGDTMDLAWMLDALIAGWGGAGLLEAYGLERRRVAVRNSSFSTRNYKAWVNKEGRENVLDDTPEGDACRKRIGEEFSRVLQVEWLSRGVGLGYRYEGSPLIVPDGTPEPADDPATYTPTARPGHRAPHVWLSQGKSILDLFGDGFVLLRFGSPPVEVGPLVTAAEKAGVPLTVVDIDRPEIAALYERRLVLVRPDDQVAWRADAVPANPQDVIDTVRGAGAAGASLAKARSVSA